MQGLPENLHGEDRHRIREQPFGLARHWLYAIYLMQTARKGISSPQLAEALGITQKSAWFMLHRIRSSCADETLKMSGEVEMDATCIGGKETDKYSDKKQRAGRGTVGKQAVLGVRDRATGKVTALPVNSEDKACVRCELTARVKPQSRSGNDGLHGRAPRLFGHLPSVLQARTRESS